MPESAVVSAPGWVTAMVLPLPEPAGTSMPLPGLPCRTGLMRRSSASLRSASWLTGSCDRLRDGDQLGAVGKGRLDVDLLEHLGHPVQHVVAGEHLPPGVLQLGFGASVA